MKQAVCAKSGERNYGIDLFRIVSMFMVVVLHVLGQGGILDGTIGVAGNYETAWFLETAAYGAVNCYALISGYVGIRSRYRYSTLRAIIPSGAPIRIKIKQAKEVLNFLWISTRYCASRFFSDSMRPQRRSVVRSALIS